MYVDSGNGNKGEPDASSSWASSNSLCAFSMTDNQVISGFSYAIQKESMPPGQYSGLSRSNHQGGSRMNCVGAT